MANYTDYTDELEIDAGDTLAVEVESDAVESLNGEVEITAQSPLASETVDDTPGFEQETAGNMVELETEGGQLLMLVVRTLDSFDVRDDVIAHIQMGGQEIAKVTEIEVRG